jgi:hypothetical protein
MPYIIDYVKIPNEIPIGYSLVKSFPVLHESKEIREPVLFYINNNYLYIVYVKEHIKKCIGDINHHGLVLDKDKTIDIINDNQKYIYVYPNNPENNVGRYCYDVGADPKKWTPERYTLDKMLQYSINEQEDLSYKNIHIINSSGIDKKVLEIYQKICYYISNSTKKGGNNYYSGYMMRPLCSRSYCLI